LWCEAGRHARLLHPQVGGQVDSRGNKIFLKQKSFKNIDFCFHAKKKDFILLKTVLLQNGTDSQMIFTQLEIICRKVGKRKKVSLIAGTLSLPCLLLSPF
jgi:hypothetical protein